MRYKSLTVFLVVSMVSAPAFAQTPKLISVGQISRVDKQTKSFEMRSQAEVNNRPDVLSGGVTIGTTIGRVPPARSPDDRPLSIDDLGRRFPQPQERPTVNNDPGRQPRGTFRETVFIEEKTVCKDRTKVILCDELRVEDRVQVTGEEKSGTRGRGIYATEIVRNR